jgi:hypothetical protein
MHRRFDRPVLKITRNFKERIDDSLTKYPFVQSNLARQSTNYYLGSTSFEHCSLSGQKRSHVLELALHTSTDKSKERDISLSNISNV